MITNSFEFPLCGFRPQSDPICRWSKWTASTALFIGGVFVWVIAMALFTFGLWGDLHSGWLARFVGILLLATAPIMLSVIVLDIRPTIRREDKLKLVTRSSFLLLGFGLLEMIIALVGVELMLALFPPYHH